MQTVEEILALPAGTELDFLVGERVMGWPVGPGKAYPRLRPVEGCPPVLYEAEGREGRPWTPSRNMADAWQVVAHLIEGGLNVDVSYHRDYFPGGKWRCYWQPGYANGGWAHGDTACEAICRAALLAGLDAARTG